jgi:mannose-6-phosphate isomerase-like protein (cupin superfamily)
MTLHFFGNHRADPGGVFLRDEVVKNDSRACTCRAGNEQLGSIQMTKPIDTAAINSQVTESWFSKTLTTINEVNVRFRVMQDIEAKFHTHSDCPECFFVLSGQVTIDTENSCETLGPGQFFRVEPGISHRARVCGRATLLVLDQFPSST